MTFECPRPAKFCVEDLARFHAAAKLIEYDAAEGVQTCTERYGRDIAGALLVAFLRRSFGSFDSFPAPDDIIEKVNSFLREKGLVGNR